MKKILLVTNSLYEYRYSIYSDFINLFYEKGYEFKIVLIEDNKSKTVQTKDNINFIKIHSGYKSLKNCLDKENPEVVISFIIPSNKMLWYLFFYTINNKIFNITWTHGVNLQDPKNKIKGVMYKIIHVFSSAIILYSVNEKKYIAKEYLKKTFIANNTINFKNIPDIKESKELIKKNHQIDYKKTVLFVGRMQARKKIEVLIDIFKESRYNEFGLVIVGPGFDNHYSKLIEGQKNIQYLGAIYEDYKINSVFKSADLFCIPGTNGLGINQAMYWGLPCLALNVKHSPEIVYLVNGETGYILGTKNELSDKIYELLENDDLRNKMSLKAKNKIRKEASIEAMFEGFLNACNYVLKDVRPN